MRTLCTAAVALLVFSPASCLHAQTATPVPQLDESKFPGAWYEIAHLPNKREKSCVRDIVQLIALGDKTHQYQFVFSCTDKSGYDAIVNKTGHALHGSGAIKIPKLFFLFHTHYWVLAVDPDYKWALAGSPDHKELWLLSKTPALDAATVADLKSRATAQGYDTSRLVDTPEAASHTLPAGTTTGGTPQRTHPQN